MRIEPANLLPHDIGEELDPDFVALSLCGRHPPHHLSIPQNEDSTADGYKLIWIQAF